MLDDDRRTLHIRCGSDIRQAQRAAGLGGDFLEYADPVCEGPVPAVSDLPAVRARYLAAGAGRHLNLTEADCLARLRTAEAAVRAAHAYDRVVLWFEHDSHDQLVLARCLAALAEGPLPPVLELICVDRHPEVPRFNGLGQLSPAALAGLWPGRQPVSADQIALGQAIWAALRQPDPLALQAIALTGPPALPLAAPALWRHLRELPDAETGLSLTQHLALTLLAEAPRPIGRVFEAMVTEREPLVFLGDLGFLAVVEATAATDPSVLTIAPGPRPFARLATLTPTGRAVLAGGRDYLTLRPADRWVGGVRVRGGQPAWRFDAAAGRVAPAPR
jgi:hypothetical protein